MIGLSPPWNRWVHILPALLPGGFVWFLSCALSVAAHAAGGALPDDPRVPGLKSPAEFFGFEIGSRHLRHDQVWGYFQYLAAASKRARWLPYARSHGGRPLGVLAISAPAHLERLEAIQRSRPALTQRPSGQVPDDALLVVYLGYSVHGDEASAVNAAVLVAWHLASSESDQVRDWLQGGVYLLDPALNPDGIDRFANWANENRGRLASPRDIDREHSQPWPGGRTNYYWFDLNRDWLPLAHPESRGRLSLFHRWKPNVVLDFHEMGGTSTYFFQPGIPARTNPLTPPRNQELTSRLAAEHARVMDAAQELYFTEEQFDDFYIGKGSTYPDLHGAVGVLFEQGSTRGLRLRNEVTNRHFRDTVANQVRCSLSSLSGAHGLRGELLEFQREFYQQALRTGRAHPRRAYILTGSPSRIAAARDLLAMHAVRSFRPAGRPHLNGKSFAAGQVLVVPTAQPEVTFVRSLMEPLQQFRENLFYDVSTWHLPSALDLDCWPYEADLPEHWLRDEAPAAGEFQPLPGAAGYAFQPTELGAPRLVAALMRLGAEIRTTTRPMRSVRGGASWSEGTYLVLHQPNRNRWERIGQALVKLSAQMDVAVEVLPSSLTLQGPDLGSNTIKPLPPCQPLLVVGSGTATQAAGAVWHFLDVRLGQEATLVDTDQFSKARLGDFTCVILPDGSYGSWGDAHAEMLKIYVREGGTVVALQGAITWLQNKGVIASAAVQEPPASTSSAPATSDAAAMPPPFGSASDASALEAVAGAFLSTTIDPTHPLAFGFPDSQVPVFRDSTTRFPVPGNPYQTAARYTDVIAGYVSQRNRRRLIPSAAAWVVSSGRGRVIALADNPVFRGYTRGSERFLTNAMFLGPIMTVPAPPPGDN
ncbi:MAG: hypothetical protein J5I93_09770 [Pirellulaceae bacterium]|nr:hypothetical protein [Pirellulaceae bacterium]